MNYGEIWHETKIALITIIVVTLIVAFLFAVIYPAEKRKGNLRIAEIIKSVFGKLF